MLLVESGAYVQAGPTEGAEPFEPGEAEAAESKDRHPVRAAAALTLLAVAAGFAFSLWLMPAITGAHRWWVLQDVWPPMLAARYVSSGALGYLYSADRWFVGMPLGPIVLGPASLAGDALRLTDSYRLPIPHPSMWLLYEPYAIVLCGAVLVAGRGLMQEVWMRAGLFARGLAPRHLWTQVGLMLLVLVPAAIVSGHHETVLGLACLLAGLRLAFAGRWRGAALWFGAAMGFDLWTMLGLPLLVAMAPGEQRAGVVIRSVMVPIVLVALPFAVDPSETARALLHPSSFPTVGHALPWIRRTAQPVGWGLGRFLALVPALAIAWWIRGRRDPVLVLAAFALVFLLRPLFEAVTFAYELCPALALLFLFERARGRLGITTVVLGSGLMLGYLLHPDPLGWWAGTLAIATLLAWPAARQVVTRGADDTPVEQVPLQSPAAAPAPAPAVPAPAPAPATSLA